MYSLVLIILLPTALYANTFWTIQSFERAIEVNIQSQASAIGDTLTYLFSKNFPDKNSLDREALQLAIDNITEGETSLANIRIIVKEGNNYKAVAAQNHDSVGKTINVDPANNGEQLIAYSWVNAMYEAASVKEGNNKYWRIAKPMLDPDSKDIYALVVLDFSINQIDGLVSDAVRQAYFALAAIILISLVLVFQHTKLFSFVAFSKTLQAQNKAKDDFIRMATHELRSPVTVINMYMETLKEELAAVTSDEQKKFIERVLMSIRNLRDLMADILEVSHIQQGRVDFKPEKIAPAAVVKEIVEGVKPKAQEKGLALVFEGENFPYSFNVNLVCFKRIITNLVENSIKYTPGGKVAVSLIAETAKKRGVITVQDTGLGISAEGQKRLFEQFYRVKTRETEEIPGTGLGLWMSREMARKMGGDIMLESIEHIGSRFFVMFPLSDK